MTNTHYYNTSYCNTINQYTNMMFYTLISYDNFNKFIQSVKNCKYYNKKLFTFTPVKFNDTINNCNIMYFNIRQDKYELLQKALKCTLYECENKIYTCIEINDENCLKYFIEDCIVTKFFKIIYDSITKTIIFESYLQMQHNNILIKQIIDGVPNYYYLNELKHNNNTNQYYVANINKYGYLCNYLLRCCTNNNNDNDDNNNNDNDNNIAITNGQNMTKINYVTNNVIDDIKKIKNEINNCSLRKKRNIDDIEQIEQDINKISTKKYTKFEEIANIDLELEYFSNLLDEKINILNETKTNF